MAMQLELRRHPTNFFAKNRIAGEEPRGPLEPDDPAYPEAFRPMRAIYCDGICIGYCNLASKGPVNLLPSVRNVLPQMSETERKAIEDFVNSHRGGNAPGRFVDAIKPIPAENSDLDDDEEDEDDDE